MIDDGGFVDPEAAKVQARAIFDDRIARMRQAIELDREENEELHASIVRRQAEILLQLIDQRIRRERLLHQPFGFRLVSQFRDFAEKILGKSRKLGLHDPHEGDLESVRHLDVDQQLAELIFKHPNAALRAHFRRTSHSSSVADASSAADTTHRLSGDPK